MAVMVDIKELNDAISESGLRPGFIADRMGISLQTLNNKRKGITGITASEAYMLTDILHLEPARRDTIFIP